MTFNPNDYLINLRGQKYLEVKWRIAWFRHDNPQGEINTEVVSIEPLIVRAMVAIEGRVVGSGLASADAGSKKVVWSGREVEKAETAAIGRALAVAGYGTQFTGDDFSDSDHLADSPTPIQRTSPQPEARRVPPAQPEADDKPKNVSGHVLSIEKRQAKNGSNYMLVEVSGGHNAYVWSWSETFGLSGYDIETDFSVQDGKIMPNRKIDVKLQLDDNGYYNVSEIAPKS